MLESRQETRDTYKETGDPARLTAQFWGKRNWNSVRWGNKFFVLSRQEQLRQNENLLYQHDKPNEPTKEGPLSFVLFELPFTWVSTVSRGHPSLVSLPETIDQVFYVELITPEERQRANVFRMFVKEGESHCLAIANVFGMFVKDGESHCVANS